MAIRLTGTERVLANLNREILGIKGRTRAGVMKAALLVKNRSVKRTPVDTGNLRASAYVQEWRIGKGPGAEIGYTAAYAPYVHEIDKAYRKPGTSWKFLEKALRESRKEILEIIRESAKV